MAAMTRLDSPSPDGAFALPNRAFALPRHSIRAIIGAVTEPEEPEPGKRHTDGQAADERGVLDQTEGSERGVVNQDERQSPPMMPYPGTLDQQLLRPSAPLPPGAGIRVFPIPLIPPVGEVHPPTWAPDPTGRHQWRWWSGVGWTDHVGDDGVAGEDPIEG
jgi:hypothetical protein